MNILLRYILSLALTMTVALPAMAQIDEEDIEDDGLNNVADPAMIDSISPDSMALPWPQSVQKHIAKLLKSDMFNTSQVGLMVYDLDADSAIYRHNERQLLRPASTMKIVTAVAAIDKLGGDYQFKTELCYTGKVENNTLTGDVYCVGGFDPRFNTDDMNAFIESLQKMGVDTIRGHIYADKSMKDLNAFGEGWCWDDDNPTLSPLLIGRKDKFVDKFMSELREAGIVVDAFGSTGRKPEDAFCICRRFHTIDQILMRMLKESDNLYAESMFYQLAASTGNRPATAKSARAVIKRLIQKLGLNPSGYRIADGSGLSLYNYVSTELEVALLRYAYRNGNIYLHLQPALPTAGVDGTLEKRMRGPFTRGRVWGKTGTLAGISSLAGYCKAANGHMLAFAIINQGVMHGNNGRAFQDKVCETLCAPH
ncbi:MAG TPA: D-alanyl-D-alanine carboxypeptidase/D-alanyl-D-alanine-endopeptidase [Prevotella sp.]